nr:unnamed protein product [Callosobruchus chinensis]
MKVELLMCREDQEKCYILAKRYVLLMDHLFKITDDLKYTCAIYLNDYNTVKELMNTLRNDLEERLSANTLGNRLAAEIRVIWERRDQYDSIIMMDYNTCRYNYFSSKLERLRSYIVEWDYNRTYKQLPFILDGGIKEFVEWYPSEVDNPTFIYLKKNCEIDELLDLDNIEYPGSGIGFHRNLRIDSAYSMENLPMRIDRDFGDDDDADEDALALRAIRSEGALPKDSSQLKDLGLPGPFTRGASPKARLLKPVELPEKWTEIGGSSADTLSSVPLLPPIDRSFKPTRVQKPDGEDKRHGYTGIQNYKNSCFMSCILQCMKVVPMLKEFYVLSNQFVIHNRRVPSVFNIAMGPLRNTRVCYRCTKSTSTYETEGILNLSMRSLEPCRLEELMHDYLCDYLVSDFSCQEYICNEDGTIKKHEGQVMFPSSLDAPCTNYTLSPSMRERFRPVTTMPLVFLMPPDFHLNHDTRSRDDSVEFNDTTMTKITNRPLQTPILMRTSAVGFFYIRQQIPDDPVKDFD